MTHLSDDGDLGGSGHAARAGAVTAMAITKAVRLRDRSPTLIAGVVRLAFEAEAADHHPDLSISYKKVVVSYSTHSEGA